jgi:hypothetical protein
LEAAFASKLARSRKFVVDGKLVRRAPKRSAPEEEEEDDGGGSSGGGDDVDEDDGGGGSGGPQRGDVTQRPSYIAWHRAPAAQRFGRFRHARTRTNANAACACLERALN